jgi:DNA-binding transcriptional LysR family regulator
MNSQMPPRTPRDLLQHPLLAFSLGKPEHKSIWHFVHKSGQYTEDLSFVPFLIANDFAGLKPAILAGVGIGELPDILQASLLQDKRLIQIMPDWHFPSTSVWLVHLGGRHMSRTVRVFKEFAVRMVPELFAHFAETECCRDPAEDSTVWDQAGATVE